jgi:hypothetical protein
LHNLFIWYILASYQNPLSMKTAPLAIVARAILLYLLSMVVFWIITISLDAFTFSISGSLKMFGSLINSIFFLSYLLLYIDALSKRGIMAFLPFIISFLFLIDTLYGFWFGNLAEMSFGFNSSVRVWHWRCVETLVVLVVCLRVYKKYFRSSRTALAAV